MNIIDKAIEYIAPIHAAKRYAARKVMTVYNTGYSNSGASRGKKSLRGWNYRGGSPEEDITENQDVLRQRSRDLYMGAPLATGAIKTFRTNVIGAGLKLRSQIDYDYLNMSEEEASEWERNTEREFALWAKHCDASRMMNFYEMQALVFLSMLLSGDVFATFPLVKRHDNPYLLKIMLIEGDRVKTPLELANKDSVKGGIEVDKYGAPIAYHITKKHPLAKGSFKNESVKVAAYGPKTGRRNVIHLMEHERPGQKRGVPILAPVIESLKQLTRYSEAELMAAVISSMLTIFITTDIPEEPLGQGYEPEQQKEDTPQDINDLRLGNGTIVSLRDGEKIQTVDPSRPNQAFDGFITSMSRQIGSALELPHELLNKHFTASYSASRAALLEAWKTFKMRRTWIANKFCQPIYEEFLYEAVARGRIEAPGFFNNHLTKMAYCGAEWFGPSPGQIDPLKEVKAAEWRVTNSFSTRAKEAAELTGMDFDRIIKERVREEKLMRKCEEGSNAK